jgi:hypothetical protein
LDRGYDRAQHYATEPGGQSESARDGGIVHAGKLPVASDGMSRFQPGDHLQVSRGLYHHHGIYVSDERVIQFGSGVPLADKSHTRVDAVSLSDFENGGTAEVVRHGHPRLITAYDPPADEPGRSSSKRSSC